MVLQQLGIFAGGALTFVRELLQGEGIAHREQPRGGHDGEARSAIWIAAAEHGRALALLAAAQTEAEAAAGRETAQLAAEASRAATDATRIAAVEAHREARRTAQEARRRAWRRPRLAGRRPPTPSSPPHEGSIVVLRLVGGALIAFILFVLLITFVGGRWGTHPPTPGRHKVTVCNQGFCRER